MKLLSLLLLFPLSASANSPLPAAPTDPQHPGSRTALLSVVEQEITCSGRKIWVFLPRGVNRPLSVVSFGHGQALGVDAYRKTMEHLAAKGVAAVFPMYDTGFFDQDWQRMGRDFLQLTRCAMERFPGTMNENAVVVSGHSKGAYVASVAAGLASTTSGGVLPRAVVLFSTAGSDPGTLRRIDPMTATTVVYADGDRVVDRSHSERVFREAGSHWRQFIDLRSYSTTRPALTADHFWPLTRRTTFGGGEEGPLHYYGAWKWLVAAAWDLADGQFFDQPFIYGSAAGDKGVPGLSDSIRRLTGPPAR